MIKKFIIGKFFVALVGITIFCSVFEAAASNTWTPTGSLNTARAYHTTVLLGNGQVLVVGGAQSSTLGSAELYNPATGTWTATGSLNTARTGHSAVLLANGQVLVAWWY